MPAPSHRDIFAADIPWALNDEGVQVFTLAVNPSREDSPLVILALFPPNFGFQPHTHGCDYVEYVVEGRIRVGKIDYGPGDFRAVRSGAGYGPLKVGEEGCKVLIVFEQGNEAGVELLPRREAATAARDGISGRLDRI